MVKTLMGLTMPSALIDSDAQILLNAARLNNWLCWEWTWWLAMASYKRSESRWEWTWCLELALHADRQLERRK